MIITVYAGARKQVDQKYTDAAWKLGLEIAMRGHDLIYGGGGVGCMGGVGKGVLAGNGQVVSVVPKGMDAFEELLENPTNTIITDTMAERKSIMENNSNAIVVLPGGVGTLDEFFQCLTLKELGKGEKPIILYNVDHYYDPVITLLDHCKKEGFLREGVVEMVSVAENEKEAVDFCEKLAVKRG